MAHPSLDWACGVRATLFSPHTFITKDGERFSSKRSIGRYEHRLLDGTHVCVDQDVRYDLLRRGRSLWLSRRWSGCLLPQPSWQTIKVHHLHRLWPFEQGFRHEPNKTHKRTCLVWSTELVICLQTPLKCRLHRDRSLEFLFCAFSSLLFLVL